MFLSFVSGTVDDTLCLKQYIAVYDTLCLKQYIAVDYTLCLKQYIASCCVGVPVPTATNCLLLEARLLLSCSQLLVHVAAHTFLL